MKVGILGCGQAGSRIAIALRSIDPNVELIAGEPNQSSAIFDESSIFHVAFAAKHEGDSVFFENKFDALIISPDPISLFGRVEVLGAEKKMPFISAIQDKTLPILLERPLGYLNGDPKLFIESTSMENVRVMNYHIRLPFAKFLESYVPDRLVIDASLNCGLSKKPWRQDFENITLPVHFGDQFFSSIDREVDNLRIVSATNQVLNVDGISFDSNWDIKLTSDEIYDIRIHLDQYVGGSEYRFLDDTIRAYGSDFSATISASAFSVRRLDGSTHIFEYDIQSAPEVHQGNIKHLKKYLIEIDGYPNCIETEGLCRAIYESVFDWYSKVTNRTAICEKSFEAMGADFAARSVEFSSEVVRLAS